MTRSVSGPPGAAGAAGLRGDYLLLGLLALLWGSSYIFIAIALRELPPVTLIAARVAGAALVLLLVVAWRRERLPRDGRIWGMLLIQAVFNSIGAWTVLAWGQKFVDAGLASVLNSTSPIFVLLLTALLTRHERLGAGKVAGAVLGLAGVVLVVGTDALRGLGDQVAGQAACLTGALLYAAGAIHGRRFAALAPVVTAAGTMLWASAVLVPAALYLDRPWTLQVSWQTGLATAVLAFFCTGLALLIYFRLVSTIGSMGVASQSYLRAGIGVVLGIVVLGESLSPPVAAGLAATIAGVVLINRPRRAA
ncbi:EamA family transporter [Kaustia mangrovi]|uniref:EamA family transporter n=1 Tax=Kaustia mangrovi TaxID=2593653 RepID=A0A7S8C4M8_9HYPH|nr:EamA family transporter [Kaustia mangrovi]QPC43307.1 EamA family transporter [Kaustia mangrovi]